MTAKKKKAAAKVDPNAMTVNEVKEGAPMRSAGELAQEAASNGEKAMEDISALKVLACLRRCQTALVEIKAQPSMSSISSWEFNRTRARREDPQIVTGCLEMLEELIGPPLSAEAMAKRQGLGAAGLMNPEM